MSEYSMFDKDVLGQLGIVFQKDKDLEEFICTIEDELECNIGKRISEGLPDYLLEEFENINDDAEASEWLWVNRPDYGTICLEEIIKLKRKIIRAKSELPGIVITVESEINSIELRQIGYITKDLNDVSDTKITVGEIFASKDFSDEFKDEIADKIKLNNWRNVYEY